MGHGSSRWFSPYGRICQVPIKDIKDKFIEVFARWGKCGAMRVDNGEPLGNPQRKTTSPLSLWLIANDIDMIFNKPFCPKANAKVERMQAVSARWAEVHQAKNVIDLQARLDRESLFQRTAFPVSRLGYKTRTQVFPELETSRRVYQPLMFDEKRVYEFLSKKIYIRLVSKTGQIFIFGQRFALGAVFKSQYVQLKFDPLLCQWNVFIGDKIIKNIPAKNLSKINIQNLTVYEQQILAET